MLKQRSEILPIADNSKIAFEGDTLKLPQAFQTLNANKELTSLPSPNHINSLPFI